MILDVGCGETPTGDVNVDLYPVRSHHRSHRGPLRKHLIANFVKADAMHLPFKDNSFDIVYSSHTIEHLSDPVQFLREAIRVAKRKVVVKCPHRYARPEMLHSQGDTHICYFNVSWFHKVLKNFPHIVYTEWVPKPHQLTPLTRWPSQMTIIIYLFARKREPLEIKT